MIFIMTKIQLSLTDQETDILSAEAAQLGYNLTKFIKFLISKTSFNITSKKEIPEFKMSKKAENITLAALDEYKKDKSIKVTSFKKLAQLS